MSVEVGNEFLSNVDLEVAADTIYALLVKGRELGGVATGIGLKHTTRSLQIADRVCLKYPHVIAVDQSTQVVLKFRAGYDASTTKELRHSLDEYGHTGIKAVRAALDEAAYSNLASAIALPDIASTFTSHAADDASDDADDAIPVIQLPHDGEVLPAGSLDVAGLAQPRAAVDIYDGPTQVFRVTADGKGRWDYTIPHVDAGSHAITARAGDKHSAAVTITVRKDK